MEEEDRLVVRKRWQLQKVPIVLVMVKVVLIMVI